MIIASNNVTLYRTVNNKVRYYTISFYLNLFDEYILERRYGSIKNKTPTGVKKEFHKTLDAVVGASLKKIEEKLNKGYCRSKR